MNSWDKSYNFNVDNWYKSVSSIIPQTQLIPLTVLEVIGLLRGFDQFLVPLSQRVQTTIASFPLLPIFFRLSTRSGKDAWEQLDPSLGIDTEDQMEEKIKRQLDLLKVSSYHDIICIIRASKRLRDDLLDFIEHGKSDQTISIVLQEWKPCTGIEYRCFVDENKLIAWCPYFEGLQRCSREAADDVNIELRLRAYIESIQSMIPFESYVLDVDVNDNNDIRFIELNPFNDETDPIVFSWDSLSNRSLFGRNRRLE